MPRGAIDMHMDFLACITPPTLMRTMECKRVWVWVCVHAVCMCVKQRRPNPHIDNTALLCCLAKQIRISHIQRIAHVQFAIVHSEDLFCYYRYRDPLCECTMYICVLGQILAFKWLCSINCASYPLVWWIPHWWCMYIMDVPISNLYIRCKCNEI